MKLEYLLYFIFPAIFLVIALFKAKVAPKGEIHEDFLSLKQSKMLQGIAAVGIVMHHLVQYITEYGANPQGPITLFIYAGIYFTSFFFFCSGFGLMTSFQTKKNYLDAFLKKRLSAVLLPFFVANIIYTVGMGLYFGSVNSALGIIGGFLGVRLVNTNAWFLVEITILYIAFYFIFRYIKNSDKAMKVMSLFVVAMILFSLFLGHDYSEYGGHWFKGEWWYNTTIYFIVGMLMAKYYNPVVAFLRKHYKWLLPTSILLSILLFYGEGYIEYFFGYYQEWEGHPGYGAKFVTLLYQTLCCGISLLMVLLIIMKVKVKNVVLYLLGEVSLELYLVHEIIKTYMVYDARRDGLQLVFWVYLISFTFAFALHFLNVFLIETFLKEERPIDEEYMTPELRYRLQEKQKKKRRAIFFMITTAVILVFFAIGELYIIFVRPVIYFNEEVETLATAEVGDVLYFGTMDTDPIEPGVERLSWYVADRQGDEVLLVCTHVLVPCYYNNAFAETCWKDSALRTCCELIYEDTISKYEKDLVLLTDVETKANPEFGTDGGAITQDYMFVLSVDEVELYFPEQEARQIEPTDTAIWSGVNVNGGLGGYNWIDRADHSWWWTRTLGEDAMKGVYVDQDGAIDYEGKYCTMSIGGVRPAMWVKCPAKEE